MKWIYGELRNVLDLPIDSYKINPTYIMAVDLNKHRIILKDFEHPLYYNKEDEEQILKLIGGDDNDNLS